MAEPLLIAKHDTTECHLLPGLANRHGLITGATGTGKTVTLQTLAENFSRIGVPVFMADVKGDLTGASQPGKIGEKLAAVLKERGLPMPTPLACFFIIHFFPLALANICYPQISISFIKIKSPWITHAHSPNFRSIFSVSNKWIIWRHLVACNSANIYP